MLELKSVSAGYSGLKVLFSINLNLDEGEAVALVGSNGAGKTTLLRVISGLVPLTSGQITWMGKDISQMPAHKRPELGIAHIPQGRGILGTLTVHDNLMLGGYTPKSRKRRLENIEKAYELYPVLKERKNKLAGSLSGGQQQMLAIARALIMEPKLLILDEPSLGLAPLVVEGVFDIIRNLKEQNTSLLIIEQNLIQALSVANRGYVMEAGHITITGSSQELRENPQVQKAYLGI